MNNSAKNRKNYIKLNIHIIINVTCSDIFFASYFYSFYFKTKNEKYRVPISTKRVFLFYFHFSPTIVDPV